MTYGGTPKVTGVVLDNVQISIVLAQMKVKIKIATRQTILLEVFPAEWGQPFLTALGAY